MLVIKSVGKVHQVLKLIALLAQSRGADTLGEIVRKGEGVVGR